MCAGFLAIIAELEASRLKVAGNPAKIAHGILIPALVWGVVCLPTTLAPARRR